MTAETIDDCVRLNEIQVLGTHNSYHLAPAPPVLAMLGERGRTVDYSHRPLAEQLSRLNIRKLELDVFADPEGGRFASPAALRVVKGLDPVGAELREAGFKVLHNPDLDYRTTCSTLKRCLTIVRDWSRAHPSHVPIMIMIEAKDSPQRDPDGIGFVRPLPIGPAELRALDDEIRSVFPARTGSTTRRNGAFRSGAHYVSTDYPETSPFGSGYRAALPGVPGLAARCNPVNAPAGCRSEWLEPAAANRRGQ